MSVLPAKTHAILLVDPNAVLPCPISAQPLEPVARRNAQLAQIAHPIQLRQFAADDRPQHFRARPACSPAGHSVEQVLGSSVGERFYHEAYYNGYRSKRSSAPRAGT